MRKTSKVLFCLGSMLLLGCTFTMRNGRQSLSTSNSNSSINEYSSEPPKCGIYQLSDFEDYQRAFSPCDSIFVWKDNCGDYMCYLRQMSEHSFINAQLIRAYQLERPCPLSVMRQIIEGARKRYSAENDLQVSIYETVCPLDGVFIDDLSAAFHSAAPSRNKAIYVSLGLEDRYNNLFGDSNAVYFDCQDAFENESDPAFKIYPKYFTNLSHVYHWSDDEGNDRYGFWAQKDFEGPAAEPGIFFMQHIAPCEEQIVAKIIASYYKKNSCRAENLIVDIPWIDGQSDYDERLVPAFPDCVCKAQSAYETLGLMDSYRFHFGA